MQRDDLVGVALEALWPHWIDAARLALDNVRPDLESIWKKAADASITASSLTPAASAALSTAAAHLLRSLYPRIPLDWLQPAPSPTSVPALPPS